MFGNNLMIKAFPKYLLPLISIFISFFLMLISGIFGLDKENEGYLLLLLTFIIFYILIPLQLILILIKIIYSLWKKYKSESK